MRKSTALALASAATLATLVGLSRVPSDTPTPREKIAERSHQTHESFTVWYAPGSARPSDILLRGNSPLYTTGTYMAAIEERMHNPPAEPQRTETTLADESTYTQNKTF